MQTASQKLPIRRRIDTIHHDYDFMHSYCWSLRWILIWLGVRNWLSGVIAGIRYVGIVNNGPGDFLNPFNLFNCYKSVF